LFLTVGFPRNAADSGDRGRQRRRDKKKSKKRKRKSSSPDDSSSSSSSQGSSDRNRGGGDRNSGGGDKNSGGGGKDDRRRSRHSRKRTKGKKKSKRDSSSSSSSSTGGRRTRDGSDSEAGSEPEELTRKEKRQQKLVWRQLADAWPLEHRPVYLQKISGIGTQTLAELLFLKAEIEKVEDKRNLGQEIFQRDGVSKKIRHKAQSDNGSTKRHPARYHRQVLLHPKEYYKEVPTKREVVIRNFPMEHLGMTGQVSDSTVGRLHNRTVVLTFDNFGKSTLKKGGKYSDLHQLQEGVFNYGTMLHALWPMDYTLFAMYRVLHDAHWGEIALPDEKRRSELVVEFFNAVLQDNCGKAVHAEYPLVFHQVINVVFNIPGSAVTL
jgi:hypothetical protein